MRTAILSFLFVLARAVFAQPLLVVLEGTGETRDGLPVMRPHAAPQPYLETLGRGYSGRLLRLHLAVQTYLNRRGGPAPEPTYLCMTGNEGGFARQGFWLAGERKAASWYVDLHRSIPAPGRFGSILQTFPHELFHVLQRELTGDRTRVYSTLSHAVGVRTDPQAAFEEGFAEHCQVMAIDDPEAPAVLRQFAENPYYRDRAERTSLAWAREAACAFPTAGHWRLTFPIWYQNAEREFRYSAVRENRFAYEPELPKDIFQRGKLLEAYLMENLLPGRAGGRARRAERQLSTEGVVAHLAWRWAISPELGARTGDAAMYRQFGVDAQGLCPVEHSYLKMFHAMALGRPHTAAQFVAAYIKAFPDDEGAARRIVSETLAGQALPESPEIWLVNDVFVTGSSLLDQFRASPRAHAFDLNSAAMSDLMSVPGIDFVLAQAILNAAPYRDLNDLTRVPGLTAAHVSSFRSMVRPIAERDPKSSAQGGYDSHGSVILPYLWRAALVAAAGALASALLFRVVARARWSRAVLAGVAAIALQLFLSWAADLGPLKTLLAPVALFGLPASAWIAVRRRSLRESAWCAASWLAASFPALALGWPWP